MAVIKTELRKVLFENIIVPFLSTIAFAVLVFATVYMIGNRNEWVTHSDQVLITIEDVEKNFLLAQANRREVFLGVPNAKKAYFDQYERLQEKIKNLSQLISHNKQQQMAIENVLTELKIWHNAILPIFSQAENNPRQAIQYFKEAMGKFNSDSFREAVSQLRKEEQNLRAARSESAQNTTGIIVVILLPLLIAITGITVFRGRKSILKISVLYEEQSQRLIQKMEEVSRQNWLQNHEAGMAKSASSLSSLNELGENVLKYCVEHFFAIAGSFYVRQADDSDVFVLLGSVGISQRQSKDGMLNVFSANETFNGLSIKTKTMQKLDVSQATSKWMIRSSVLDVTPHSIVSVPLLFSDEVYAVIELAFPRDIDDEVLYFLRHNLEGIASQTRNQLLLQQTQELLAQLSEKSVELEQQQAELKTSNEELEERAQLLRESQQEVETRNHELEESNVLLEEQAENLERKNWQLEESKKVLNENAKELERANKYKSQFLANMSHELRTPLNSTLILAQLLAENRDANLTSKQVEYAKQIHRSGNDLLALINDILDLSKVESGHLDFEVSTFNTTELLESLQANFSIIAENKGLRFNILDRAHTTISHDRLRLMQVLNNLTSNAIKFTEKGSITVELTNQDSRHITILVHDTGIGIEKENLNLIFDPFRQADASITRKYGGTGLGLSITKKIVESMGGSIKVSSTVDQGTQFEVCLPKDLGEMRLPVKAPLTSTVSAADVDRVGDRDANFYDDQDNDQTLPKVLIVEDDKNFAKVLFESVSTEGFSCLVAHSAEEALKFLAGQPLLAILLDIQLPDHSGLFVLENVRRNDATKKVPVFIISAFDSSLLGQNADDLVKVSKKPLTKGDLDKIISEIQDFSHHLKGKILIVEDDPHQAGYLKDHLSAFRTEVDVVDSGKKAYEILVSAHNVDCVILDYKLPDCIGLDLLQRVHATLGAPPIPLVIVHTAMNLSREDEMELKKYCKSIVIKGQKSLARITSDISTFLKSATVKREGTAGDKIADTSTDNEYKKSLQDIQVLVVDDDVRNVYSMTAFLEEAGGVVTMASNGQDAIEVLKTKTEFDVVLMDIMMPMMDGYQAIRIIRDNLNFKMLPIIALTAKAMQEDRKKCIEAGANDYLTKPVDLEKLIMMIKMWSNRGVWN